MMSIHDNYNLDWNPYESQQMQTERAHQRWLQAEAVRARRTRAQRPRQPRR